MTVVYFQPPLPGTDRLELRCTPNVSPRIDDVYASRPLSAADISTVAKLASASDLYSGGHAGNYAFAPGSEGPFTRLEVGHCCGREERVVLIVTGNPTFSTGGRRELLNLLNQWSKPLHDEVMKARMRKD